VVLNGVFSQARRPGFIDVSGGSREWVTVP